jgi:GT2 family glycosyltransferase
MNILIAVPSMDSVPAVFAQSLAMLEKVGDCAIAFQVGSLVYTSRNDLALKAIRMGADFVLWLDSDMLFEPDTLKKLMKTLMDNNLDMVSGIYYRRIAPYTPVLLKKLEINESGKCESEGFKETPVNLFEVEGCGFGCVLMKSKVLFDVIAHYQDAFTPMETVGEDLAFCIRARNLGYKIYADPGVSLGHCSHQIITKKFYEAFIQASKERKNDE